MSNDISTETELHELPIGAVVETSSRFIGWIKQNDGSFANYQNWPRPPAPAAEILFFATTLKRGTRMFEINV